jgi:hypothetical protein
MQEWDRKIPISRLSYVLSIRGESAAYDAYCRLRHGTYLPAHLLRRLLRDNPETVDSLLEEIINRLSLSAIEDAWIRVNQRYVTMILDYTIF